VAHVWDITQTDGEPLADVRPTLLTGEAPVGLWDALAQELSDAGYALEGGDCQGANGRTNYLTRTVTVREDVDDAQAVRTLIHELAHVWLHDPHDGAHHRGRAEVEAESVAYIVSEVAGLHPEAYSLPYVAVWSDGDIDTVRSISQHRRVPWAVLLSMVGEASEPGILEALRQARRSWRTRRPFDHGRRDPRWPSITRRGARNPVE
jgi:hypothetical protein